MNLCSVFDIINYGKEGINLDSRHIGSKIRTLRMREGLTLERLAVALNIKRNMLSNYELGKSTISAELLTKVADYFNVSLDYFAQHQTFKLAEEKSTDGMLSIPVYASLHSCDIEDSKNLSEILYSLSIPEIMLLDGTFFGLAVTDDSLELKSCSRGSILITKKQSVARSGELIIYSYNNENARYGIYTISDENVIISPASSNDIYSPVVYKTSDKRLQIIGKVVMMLGHIKN